MSEMDERLRDDMEYQLNNIVTELKVRLDINANRRPDARVQTLTSCIAEGDRFIAVNGSAHEMGRLFAEVFRQRPEFRQVVQNVLDDIYNV